MALNEFFTYRNPQITNFGRKQKIIIGLIFLSLALAVSLWYFSKKPHSFTQFASLPQTIINKISQTFRGKTAPAPTLPLSLPSADKIFSARQIAQAAIDFLDAQKRPDGFYNYYPDYEKRCQQPHDSSLCSVDATNVIEVTNMWTLLARVSFYKNFSSDLKDLAQAEADAQALINFCNQNLKKCWAAVIPLSELDAQTSSVQYQQLLKKLGELLLGETLEGDPMALGTQARELARLYQIFGDHQYLQEAYQRLAEAETTSTAYRSRYGESAGEICYLVLAQTEIGQAGNDQNLANQAASFFKEDKEREVPGQLTLIQPCLESAFKLSDSLNDQALRSKASYLLEKYVTERWAGPGLKRNNEEGGFFLGEDKNLLNITDAAYMIYLLGFEPDKNYLFSDGY